MVFSPTSVDHMAVTWCTCVGTGHHWLLDNICGISDLSGLQMDFQTSLALLISISFSIEHVENIVLLCCANETILCVENVLSRTLIGIS